jgi:hypothetical protein
MSLGSQSFDVGRPYCPVVPRGTEQYSILDQIHFRSSRSAVYVIAVPNEEQEMSNEPTTVQSDNVDIKDSDTHRASSLDLTVGRGKSSQNFFCGPLPTLSS